MYKYSKEITKFIKNIVSDINGEEGKVRAVIPIILNYNKYRLEENPNLTRTIEGDTSVVVEDAMPVLIYYCLDKTDKEQQFTFPGIHITRRHFKKENGVKIDKEVTSEVVIKAIMTYNTDIEHEEIKAQATREIPTQAQINKANLIDTVGYSEYYSKVMEDYLMDGVKGESLDRFEELICFYPEMDRLTYIDKMSHSALMNVKIGEALSKTENKSKGVQSFGQGITVESMDKLTRMTKDDYSNKIKQPTDKTIESTEVAERIKRIIKNYFESNHKVFSILSSKGRTVPLTVPELMYSCSDKAKLDKFAYKSTVDPVTINAKTESDKRSVGYLDRLLPPSEKPGLLPVFTHDTLNHIIMGNYPFMLIQTKHVDSDNFNNDVLHNIKSYMLMRAVELTNLTKSKVNYSYSEEERYVMENAYTMVNRKKIRNLYCNEKHRDLTKVPTGISYGKVFDLCFIDFAIMNTYLKTIGTSYKGDITQILKELLPIEL